MRSALALVLVLVTACGGSGDSGDDDAPGADAAGAEVCSPPATEAPPPVGDGTAPVGHFSVEWRCVDGCAGGFPLVVMQGNGIDIASDGVVRWLIDDAPLYPIGFDTQNGCWYLRPSVNGCHSALAICDINGPRVDRVFVRSPFDGHEEAWEMR
jgi:hypothetical protein